MTASLYDFDRVSVTSGEVLRLRDVTLAIPAGGTTVVVGPSGSGKSTLLRLCNRLEVPTSGEVRFRGTPLDELDPLVLRQRAGMVFQRPTVFAGSVRDNLRVADPHASEEAMQRSLERASLDAGALDRTADELSGGEQQRVCLARTFITGPETLLMDEPTSALDPQATRAIESVAESTAAGGCPVVWVTHDLSQMRRIADHIVVLMEGRVVRHGPLDEVLGSPTELVREYLEGDDHGIQ
ncbi:MAG: Glutamine transport ATP-binding protein GlnQ [Acidimicrobiales bacterium]|nr:MAG: phosphate ABC transporter ATP-binding protein [Actinomycetota bacterium]MBV6508733.1 Glutamine transport ATP-binding protein GlnQ [Acidimicrobiales bacterium]RIK08163.1 MAG: glycine/betaine ABC transporter [Acidobacteriota bacterium]